MFGKKKKKQTQKSTAKRTTGAKKPAKQAKAKSTAKSTTTRSAKKQVDKQSSTNTNNKPKSAKLIDPQLFQLAQVLEEERIIKTHEKKAKRAITKEKEKELIAHGIDKSVAQVMAEVFYKYNL